MLTAKESIHQSQQLQGLAWTVALYSAHTTASKRTYGVHATFAKRYSREKDVLCQLPHPSSVLTVLPQRPIIITGSPGAHCSVARCAKSVRCAIAYSAAHAQQRRGMAFAKLAKVRVPTEY